MFGTSGITPFVGMMTTSDVRLQKKNIFFYILNYIFVECIFTMCFKCFRLVELNLAWTRLDSECIDIVCKLVNENVRQLNLSGGLKYMKDSRK